MIDAHEHIWTNDFTKYPLAAPYTSADMKPSVFLPSDILNLARPSGVTRIVLVQMVYYGTDNSYMLDTMRQSPGVFGGIAVVDPEGSAPDVEMRELAQKGVRGFRIYPAGFPADASAKVTGWLSGEGIDKMFRCGAKERLAICLLTNPNALEIIDHKCEKYPDTPVIIDHIGRIGASGPITEMEVKALTTLARHPEVKVKVSAFYYLGQRKPPHLDLGPMIKRLLDAFGPKRLMLASDCPFQTVNETYEDSISLVRDHLDFLSNADKEFLLRSTAEEIFFPSRGSGIQSEEE